MPPKKHYYAGKMHYYAGIMLDAPHIERFHMTSQISREIWVAMLVFHIFKMAANPLSDYANNRDPHVKKRYCEKISCVGIDLILISEKNVWSRLFATGRIHGFAIIFSVWEKLLQQGAI